MPLPVPLWLLERGASAEVMVRQKYGSISPLIFTLVFNGRARLVEELLRRDAALKDIRMGMSTLMHTAAGRGAPELVRVLLACAPEQKTMRDRLGRTPLEFGKWLNSKRGPSPSAQVTACCELLAA